MDKRYQVFVSSTFIDLENEREIAVQTLMKMNCIPSGMELFPAADIEQFEFIKTVINDCDYYLLIIGGKYGSMTDEGISYTEKEYHYAISKGIKVIAFLHKNPETLAVRDSEVRSETIEKLNNFRDKVSKGRLVEFWENKDQLAGMIALGISSMTRMYPATGWVRADKASTLESLEENNNLRKKNNELEKKLAKLEESTSINTNDQEKLASLDSTLGISILNSQINTEVLKINVSWSDILKCISEIIFEPISEYRVRTLIIDICTRNHPEVSNLEWKHISSQDSNTIKIQLYALGYIDICHLIDENDGETYQAWKITEKGKKVILNLVAIKN